MLPWIVTSICLVAAPAPQDAPQRMLSTRGVELRADEGVFTLFAALNAAGYSAETARTGPPLFTPRFHPVRAKIRDALRAFEDRPAAVALRSLFQENQAAIAVYLAATKEGGSPEKKATPLATALRPRLDAFATEADLPALFDQAALAYREQARPLLRAVDGDLELAAEITQAHDLRAPTDLVVVPNPLDAYGAVRRASARAQTWLVLGPGLSRQRAAVVEAVLRPRVRTWVDRHYAKAGAFEKSWRSLRRNPTLKAEYGSGRRYLTDALTRALAHRVRVRIDKTPPGAADAAFIDAEAKADRTWARAALKIVDRLAGRTFAERLGRELARVTP